MIEKPIIFSGPMVRAIIEGRKSQTRRIVKPQPVMYDFGTGGVRPSFVTPQTKSGYLAVGVQVIKCGDTAYLKNLPYGTCGDRLWVRETWMHGGNAAPAYARKYRADEFVVTGLGDFEGERWIPGIHMFRWASRITLEVTSLRVERLNDISEEDAKAEAAEPWQFDPQQTMTTGELGSVSPYRGGFAVMWDEINDERATWKSNPWVWVISFKRI